MMLRTRVIPCLLLKNSGLVKTVKFKDAKYLGDPINTVKIFNDKEVDELFILDITATVENRKPNFKLISEIASECFMPLGYGGGVRDLEDIRTLFHMGIEKVAINSYALENPDFVSKAADRFGSQSIIVSMDVKKSMWGKFELYTRGGRQRMKMDPVDGARLMEKHGAGEIFLNSIDKDGTMQGYDLELIKKVSGAVRVPVVACGGAGSLSDMVDSIRTGGASAASAGSMFVYQGKHRAVLINYPTQKELASLFD